MAVGLTVATGAKNGCAGGRQPNTFGGVSADPAPAIFVVAPPDGARLVGCDIGCCMRRAATVVALVAPGVLASAGWAVARPRPHFEPADLDLEDTGIVELAPKLRVFGP
jgi:hypothetical protein